MLKKILLKLDKWIDEKNTEYREEGMLGLRKCEIRVIGQCALIEAKLGIHLAATMDVDVYAEYDHTIRQKFAALLQEIGKILDPVGHEAWMPKETEYTEFYKGKWVTAFLAKPEYVILSKAKKAPAKNKNLIAEYIALPPSKHFFTLAEKYDIDLKSFLD